MVRFILTTSSSQNTIFLVMIQFQQIKLQCDIKILQVSRRVEIRLLSHEVKIHDYLRIFSLKIKFI